MIYIPESWTVHYLHQDLRGHAGVTKSGYGSRIPTHYYVKRDKGCNLRVYAICYSNSASYYVTVKGQRLFVPDCMFP